MDAFTLLAVAVVLAVILWLLFKAIFQTYYTEREKFADRIVAKLKRQGTKDNGKGDSS